MLFLKIKFCSFFFFSFHDCKGDTTEARGGPYGHNLYEGQFSNTLYYRYILPVCIEHKGSFIGASMRFFHGDLPPLTTTSQNLTNHTTRDGNDSIIMNNQKKNEIRCTSLKACFLYKLGRFGGKGGKGGGRKELAIEIF